MTQTAEIAQRLYNILAEEERLYLEMKTLLQEERQRMVLRDADGIEVAVRRKEGLAGEGKLLEACRRKVMCEMAAVLGLPDEEATLSRVCAALGSESVELRSIHGRLVALIAAVRELLEVNSSFAGEALIRVQSTLRLLGRLLPDEPTYGRTPASQIPRPHMKPGRIVRQTA
ncbi:MAG: flagellar protein FlgN [Myxococcales bacterium]|nr:flagellar protein FlgN [Myxococcales bacterium]